MSCCNTSAARALSATNIKKTALATSLTLLFGGLAAPSALAALPTTAVMTFTLGTVGVGACTYGTTPPCKKNGYNITDIVGSYFSMDIGGDGVDPADKTPIGSFNGLVIGTTQLANGSHSGSVNGAEAPNIDAAWNFFGNTGMHQTTATTTIETDSGTSVTLVLPWSVNWNGLGDIPMVSLSSPTVACGASCTATDSYTLDGAYHVAGAGFTSVAYTLHLEGSVTVPGLVPIAKDDTRKTIDGNPREIDVISNDTSADTNPKYVPNSVAIATNGANGTAAPNVPSSNIVTYTPVAGFVGQDTFVYTVDNSSGTSLASPAGDPGFQGIVTVDVQANVAPVAVDDTGGASTQELDTLGGSITIDVLANDSDANNAPGLPGGIDVATVQASVTNAAGNIGTCAANNVGIITYTQTVPSVDTVDTCTYTVTDIDSSATPKTSTPATLTVTVNTSDWPAVLPAGVIPLLSFEPGVFTKFIRPNVPDQSTMPDKSWFTMQVSATQLIYTAIAPGPDGGFIVGYDQPAVGSHTGKPDGSEQPGYSAPWLFFSNTGFDLTRNGGISNNGDGTLNFRTKYVVSWNGIEIINLGGSSQFPGDLGFATISCSDKPCQDGSTYVLDYEAHVEDVAGFDPSGFNAVPYTLHHEGTVRFFNGSMGASSGTITTETRLAASAVPPDVDDPNTEENEGVDLQCVGSCFDYTISGVANGSRVDIVLPLTGGVPNFPVWRILDNSVWRDFDTSTGDSVKTAPLVAGGPGLTCPTPGAATYIDLVNDPADPDNRPNVGHQCVQLSITDNGPNDLNTTLGIIADPSGLGTSGAPVFVDNRTSDTSGCSIATTSVAPNRRADWWLLAGFLGWLGWNRRKSAQR